MALDETLIDFGFPLFQLRLQQWVPLIRLGSNSHNHGGEQAIKLIGILDHSALIKRGELWAKTLTEVVQVDHNLLVWCQVYDSGVLPELIPDSP